MNKQDILFGAYASIAAVVISLLLIPIDLTLQVLPFPVFAVEVMSLVAIGVACSMYSLYVTKSVFSRLLGWRGANFYLMALIFLTPIFLVESALQLVGHPYADLALPVILPVQSSVQGALVILLSIAILRYRGDIWGLRTWLGALSLIEGTLSVLSLIGPSAELASYVASVASSIVLVIVLFRAASKGSAQA